MTLRTQFFESAPKVAAVLVHVEPAEENTFRPDMQLLISATFEAPTVGLVISARGMRCFSKGDG
jgi:hypothetical protein